MHLPQLILTTLSLSKLGLSIPSFDQETKQQPIIQPNDNFNLTPIRDALISNKIIGDVLNDFEPLYYLDIVYSKHDVRVSLGNEISTKDVKKRPRFGIHEIPDSNKSPGTSMPATFTLVLTDPDATSRYDPKWSEMCHWIVTNMTSTTLGNGLLEGGVELNLDDLPFKLDRRDLDEEVHPRKDKKHKKDRKKSFKHGKKGKKGKKDKQGSKKLPGELKSYLPPGPPPKTGWHRYVFVLLQGDATNLTAPKERKHWGYGEKRHGVRDWAIENGLEVVSANFFFAENKKQ